MRLSEEEKRLVEDNINLVHKVINDKVKCLNLITAFTREDLFQIGCIGLCKAVVTDKGGHFSTYAYRLIWNEICDALITNSKKWRNEVSVETIPENINDDSDIYGSDIYELLKKHIDNASASTKKGIMALIWMQEGYTSKEIGGMYGVKANLVTAWISKAKKYLKNQKEIIELAG